MFAVLLQMLGVDILIYILQMYFPIKGKKNILFGCNVPYEQKSKEFNDIIKSYKVVNSILFILCIVGMLIAFMISKDVVGVPISVGYIVLSFIITMRYNVITKRRKLEISSEYYERKQVSIADISVQKSNYMLSILTYTIVGLIFLGINFYAVFKVYAMKNNIQSLKNINFSILITGIILFLIYIITDIMIKRAKLKIDPENPEKSQIQNEKARSVMEILTILIFIPEFVVVTIMNFNLNNLDNSLVIWSTIIAQIVTLIIAIILSVKISKLRNNYKSENENVRIKDDDDCWKFGVIYYNKNNPNTFVEKRSGVGITVNAGTKGGMTLYIVILLIIVSTTVLTILAPILGNK